MGSGAEDTLFTWQGMLRVQAPMALQAVPALVLSATQSSACYPLLTSLQGQTLTVGLLETWARRQVVLNIYSC